MNDGLKTDSTNSILAAIIESSEDAIISKSLDSRVTSWNKSAERMFGYTAEEMIGRQIHILIPQERYREEELIISRLKRGERVEHFETKRIGKDGTELDISLTISPIFNEKGVIVGASKIARDISSQKLAELRLGILYNLARDLNRTLNLDTILQLAVDASTRICNVAIGVFCYTKMDDQGVPYITYAINEQATSLNAEISEAIKNSSVQVNHNKITRMNDLTIEQAASSEILFKNISWMGKPLRSYLAVPVVAQSGLTIGSLHFADPEPGKFTDEIEKLSNTIALQAAITLDKAKLLQEVHYLSSKKDQYIGFASHELRTPLTTLKAYVQLAKAGKLSFEDLVTRLTPQVERLQGIVTDLLDISRIQAGKMNLKIEKVALKDLIVESCQMVDLDNHQFMVNTAKVDEVFVEVDRQKLSQAIINLVINAAKYTPNEKLVRISGDVFGENARITVEDEGIGISKEYVERIFDQYYRVPNSEATAKGVGLGLFITKEIIEAHHGRISVESELNKGSKFHLTFPVVHH